MKWKLLQRPPHPVLFFPVYALDAKMRFDDNAEFRQKEIFDERDWSQEDPKEVEASRYNLNYIALDGKKEKNC